MVSTKDGDFDRDEGSRDSYTYYLDRVAMGLGTMQDCHAGFESAHAVYAIAVLATPETIVERAC